MILAPRHFSRLTATVGLFARYGLWRFARQQGGEPVLGKPVDGDDAESPSGAVGFRTRLVELGPAYVKLGQVLSTRPHLLPPSYITELETLQDHVTPVAFERVRRVVEDELQGRLSKLFGAFDETPLAAASLGQVHAAELRDGRGVVVKVQRPDIRESLADDIDFFGELAGFVTAHTAAGARVDLVGIVHQLERTLADELDYRVEARNAASFRQSLSEFPRILIPKVIEAYSTAKVLTVERIHGVKIDDLSPFARLDHDLRPVANDLTRAYLKQITIDGHFHADPHPGNVFVVLPGRPNPRTPSEVRAMDRRNEPREPVTPLSKIEQQAQATAAPPPPDMDVRLALIDFGMTARLSSNVREQVVRLLLDVADNRGHDAAETLVEMGSPLPDFDREAYVRETASLLARHYDQAVSEVDTGTALHEVDSTSRFSAGSVCRRS